MDVLEAIHTRRSIRELHRAAVADELVWQIIEAGTWAPSSGNMQAWEFVVVKEPRRAANSLRPPMPAS